MKEKIIEKILCEFFNYHNWQWSLKRVGNVCEPITGEIPDRAICTHCGATYGIDYGVSPSSPEIITELK